MLPSEMRCPSNSVLSSNAIEQMLTSPVASFTEATIGDRLGSKPYVDELTDCQERVLQRSR